MPELYGLKNCDTCRKARKWLAGHGIDVEIIDLRAATPDRDILQRWLDAVGEDALINRRSTTWRQLDAAARAMAAGVDAADLLARHPTLIKRPLLVTDDGAVSAGFAPDSAHWRQLAG